ncbi:hypothetical protein [Solibacillus daqui]|uniref:hypothetical protein n=1 Tax=Solibacillus daqui TaxID=2912187 RepID=UPI0023665EE5|nr:hypothetical protein [Solibacillus daqui]
MNWNPDEDRLVRLSESDAQAILDVFATTKVKKTNKKFKDDQSYETTLSNNGYTMSYDLEFQFSLQKNKDEVLIRADFSDSKYITKDLSIYNKLVEIMEKAPSN